MLARQSLNVKRGTTDPSGIKAHTTVTLAPIAILVTGTSTMFEINLMLPASGRVIRQGTYGSDASISGNIALLTMVKE